MHIKWKTMGKDVERLKVPYLPWVLVESLAVQSLQNHVFIFVSMFIVP